MTDDLLPEDPAGWNIYLTDDGEWLPERIGDGKRLKARPSKADAVAAIEKVQS